MTIGSMNGIINRAGKERATPVKLSLCILLHLYISPQSDLPITRERNAPIWPLQLSRAQIRLLQLFLVKSIKMIESIQEPPLSSTLLTLRRELGVDVAQRLEYVLSCIQSPDDLFDLLESMKLLLVPPSALNTASDVDTSGRPSHIEWSGIFGMFLRRVLLTSKLSFEALSRLFHDVQLYVAELRQSQRIPEGSQSVGTPVTDNGNREISQSAPFQSFVSRRQLQHFLHRKAEHIESRIGVSSPEETEAEIVEMLRVAPDLPRAHLLRYLNYLHHREYQGAVDSLHTYFDFCIRQGGPTAAGVSLPTTQYAVLNLAALHFHFGYEREATHAIQETVRVAQQNGDHTCLAYALAWLFRISAASQRSETGPIARKCLERSHELGLRNVEALTHLVAAQQLLLVPPVQATALPPAPPSFTACSAAPPTTHRVWRAMEAATQASLQGIAVPAESAVPARDGLELVPSPGVSTALDFQSLLSVAGRSELVRHAAWGLYGGRALARAGLQRHFWYLRDCGPGSDSCLALVQAAADQARTGQLADLAPRGRQDRRPQLEALFPLLRSAVFGPRDPQPGALYGPALRMLVHARTYMYPNAEGNVLLQGACRTLHRFSLAVGNVSLANRLEGAFRALAPTGQRVGGIGGDLAGEGAHAEGLLMWTATMLATGRLPEAFEAVLHTEAFCGQKQLHAQQVQLDIPFAKIFLKACGNVPAPALPHALRCLTLSSQLEHDAVRFEASLVLAQVHLQFGYVHRSLALIQRSLPYVMSNGTIVAKCEIHLLLAKCYLALGGSRAPMYKVTRATTPSRVKEKMEKLESLMMLLTRVEHALKNALKFAKQAGQVDLMTESIYLLALVTNAIHTCLVAHSPNSSEIAELLNKRNIYAKQFQIVRRSRMTPVEVSTGILESKRVLGRLCSLVA